MAFEFRAWKYAKDIGDPGEIVRACKFVSESPDMQSAPDVSDIIFEIIDVRPGNRSEDEVSWLTEKLISLMLADDELIRSLASNSRLLFVGENPSLGSYSVESGGAAQPIRRDIKRDLEFAIRTLRSYGVALYGCIDANLVSRSIDELPLARSARRLLNHVYRKPPASDEADPAVGNMHVMLSRIRDDFFALRHTAQRLGEFQHLGKHDNPERKTDEIQSMDLLREIGLLFQLGRGERERHMSPKQRLEDLARDERLTLDERDEEGSFVSERVAFSSYRLFVETLQNLAKWVPLHDKYREAIRKNLAAGQAKPTTSQEQQPLERAIALDTYKLERFDLLRDFGRVLGQGALRTLAKLNARPHILIVDDWMFETLRDIEPSSEDSRRRKSDPQISASGDNARLVLAHRLRWAFAAAWPGGAHVHIVGSDAIDAQGAFDADHFGRMLKSETRAFGLPHGQDEPSTRQTLLDSLEQYSIILIDPEATRDSLGAVRVQRIAKYLEQIRREPALLAGTPSPPPIVTPPLIAFSQKENSGYVQQCLNMGAAAFVVKHRPYHLLFDLARILSDRGTVREDTRDASQFRLLRILKPNAAAKLKRVNVPFYIHGGHTRADSSIEPHVLEQEWIRALPKADLHCHIGTAIDLDTVTLLALNSAGYFLQNAQRWDQPRDLHPNAEALIDRFTLAVQLASHLGKDSHHEKTPPIELLAAAAHGLRHDTELAWKPFGLGDSIIHHLIHPNERCDHAHATALLVASIQTQAGQLELASEDGATPLRRRCDDVAEYFDRLSAAQRSDCAKPEWRSDFTAGSALACEAVRAHRHFQRLGFRWAGEASIEPMKALVETPPADFWMRLAEHVHERVEHAATDMLNAQCRILQARTAGDPVWDEARERATEWLRDNESRTGSFDTAPVGPYTLADYVGVIPTRQRRSLQLYLRGADLLGSAHMQYPENLLIAAHAITRDNARDNVVYSEIRCETTGYCKAGMGAHDATEMLRHGFTLAELYWAGKPSDAAADRQSTASECTMNGQSLPLVRTNILLAAKRHKDVGEARQVVELLDQYLERRPANADRGWGRSEFHKRFGNSIPAWWRPCDVVGFDISGNESVGAEWLEELVRQLASRSSPITIHAGEAASAQSIWDAVYKLNAIRIGHGLRLGEDLALLGHCVREGICMEMCPNSNYLTNAFEPPAHRSNPVPRNIDGGKYAYPLLRYMREGMEVTIGTDNRYLHARGAQSLTSEYLTAARLVGGLTRWEVLQVVKAGFKNAFLDKSEVRELIGAAEEGIYKILVGDNA